MKTLLACLLSSLVAALAIGGYSTVANGPGIRILDLMLFVFLYALATAVVVGVPFHYLSKMIRKERGLCYAAAGSLAAIAFTIVPLVESRAADPSLLKLTLVLAAAGLLAGWTFFRVSRT